MVSGFLRLLNKLPRPYNWIALLVILVAVIGGGILLFGQIQSCRYDKDRAEYQKKEDAAKSEKDQLIGAIKERDKRIAQLETEKQAYKTMGEQGVKLDAAKAEQIEQIAAKEAQDLNEARQDMPCIDRARRTVELLRTAKPPINLNLQAVIRKQCSG